MRRAAPSGTIGATITETQSAQAVLSYLATHALPGLPDELWDGHLWLYGDLLALLSAPLTGYETDRMTMYTAEGMAGTAGTAVAVRGEPGPRVFVHGLSTDVVVDLVGRCASDSGAPAEVSTLSRAAAEAVRGAILPTARLLSSRRLWTREPAPPRGWPAACEVRELAEPDTALFDAITFGDGTRGWPGFRACLGSGLRYFGGFAGGRLASIAGLCRLTRARSEIIGVATFAEADRRRGYASAACRQALEVSLRESRVCTWTAQDGNVASIRTAEGMGMREYLTRHDLSVVSR